MTNRRKFLQQSGYLAMGAGLLYLGCQNEAENGDTEPKKPINENWFNISLAEWSLNRQIFGGEMDHLDFARIAKETYGIGAIEYVNQFFKDKATDIPYLKQMDRRAKDHGVKQLLIMVDGEGHLGNVDAKERKIAVERHVKWIDAARYLGCHSIRVNAAGEGSMEEVAKAAVDGLGTLAEIAKQRGINVLVENHGGYSSNGEWLAGVMAQINMDNCGTLPDFGNFCIERVPDSRDCADEYDKYQGLTELMPYAKAVSAKSYNFGTDGKETAIDYHRMLRIVQRAGYEGFIGIEFEGEGPAKEGILATKALLQTAMKEVAHMPDEPVQEAG